MSNFTWHEMDDERPEIGTNDYIVLGIKGGLYLAKRFEGLSDSDIWWFRDTRGNHLMLDKVLAWAEVPPYEGPESVECQHANG